MELSATETIDAPAEFVFAEATRFPRFAQQARQAGAKVQRLEPDPAAGRNLRWNVRAVLQGAERQFVLELMEKQAPSLLRFALDSASVKGDFVLRFAPVDGGRTRAELLLAVRGRTFKGKMAVQSARLVRQTLERRVAERLARAARGIEEAWRTGAQNAAGGTA